MSMPSQSGSARIRKPPCRSADEGERRLETGNAYEFGAGDRPAGAVAFAGFLERYEVDVERIDRRSGP